MRVNFSERFIGTHLNRIFCGGEVINVHRQSVTKVIPRFRSSKVPIVFMSSREKKTFYIADA